MQDAYGGPATLQTPAHAALASGSSGDAQRDPSEERLPIDAAPSVSLNDNVWQAPADGQLPEGVMEQQEVEMTGDEPIPATHQGPVVHADTNVPEEQLQDEAVAAAASGQL